MLSRYMRIVFLLLMSVIYIGVKAQCNTASLISIAPTCTSPGGYSLVIPNSSPCNPTGPYSLFWGTQPGCQTPTLTSVPGPGTYVITFTQSCGGGYNVVFQDGNNNFFGGANSGTVGVAAQPSVSMVQLASSQPSCAGNCNGSQTSYFNSAFSPLTVTLIPGTGSSTVFSNVSAFSPQTYAGLCAGAHTFHVLDSYGCLYTSSNSNLTFTITQPASLTATSATAQPSCFGGSNGSFSVMPSGGTATYNVVFSNNSTVTVASNGTAVATGFPAGPVSATVTDSHGCSTTATATIGQPLVINISSSTASIVCGGNCTGAATVTASGGGGGFTYSWSPGPGSNSVISTLCAGVNTVFITDANNCVKSHTLNITQPTSISITPTITNVVCNGSCTGGAAITATGATSPITFTWLAPPGGSAVSNASVITNRCAGTYTLVAAINSTCANTFTIPITQPPPITLTANTSSANCIGLCNGSATAIVSGGNGGPYTFTWTAASPPPAPQTSNPATNLCSGIYSLTTKDVFSCPATTTFNIVQPGPFSFGITSTTVTCNGGCNGVINASPSGGTSPYNYTLVSTTGSTASGTPIFSNLCAGSYTLKVRDATPACAQQTVITIVQPNPLVPSVTTTSLNCAGVCNGQLAGSASGGVPNYTYTWGTPSGTVAGGIINSLCAGTYTFNIKDANGCNSAPAVYTLTSPPALTLNISTTSVTCNGSCNGALQATVTGGTAGYTLNWSTGSSANPLTSLCAGTYTLNVTDSRSCTASAIRTVTAPTAISLTQTTTATRCAGSCDGSATVTATGGMGTYTFQFNTVPTVTNTTGVISGLCAGNYSAMVRDVNNCTVAINFNITSPSVLSAAITGTRNSCVPPCTGAGTVTASNGTPPYTGFAWINSSSSTVAAASTAANLCPGNYTVVVTDSRSCTATVTTTIGMVVIVTVVSGGTGIQCFGSCTGSAVANPSGGAAPYTYSWSPGAQTSATATGLCAGVHQVTVTDSNSPACSNTAAITVTQPSSMVVTSSATNVTCFNTCNGAISLTVTGGTGTKSFLWSPGGMTTSSVSNLCAGVYTVNITDANGCTRPPMTFTLAPPIGSVSAVISSTNPVNCNTPNTGSISVTASGGSGTYNYSWSPTGSTASSITSVPAGTYSLFITSGGCTQTFVTTLSNPAGPTLTQINLQPVACFGGTTGAATYSAGGVGPFTFTWTPASLTPTTGAASSSVSGLQSGTYAIASTDAGNACLTTQTFFVSQASSVTVNGTVTNIQCSSSPCNGSIVVSSTGGTGPYTYTWSPGSVTGATLSGQCAGVKTVQVKDNAQCTSTHTFNIITPASITISSTVTNIKCNGACNGSIVANATGGTGPITYSWLPMAGFTGSSTASVFNLCPGTYTLLAIDGNNCSSQHTVLITEPAALTSTLTFNGIQCSSDCNATATIIAGGGTPTYSFSWSSGGVTTTTIGNLCAGNYTGSVVDANGCVSSKPFTINSPPVFSLSLVPTHPTCNSACNGSIQTTATGAQGTVTYVWLPAGTGEDPTGLCPSNYLVTATDAQGCQALAVVTLTNPPALLANITTTNSTCSGVCTGVAVSTPANAQGAVSFSWLPSGPNSATNTALCAGDYTLNIQDAKGCAFTQTFGITEPPLLTVNVSSGPASCGVNNGSITASPVGGTPNYTFAWTSPVPPPILTTGSVVSNLTAGVYTLVITDANNCSNTVTIPLSNSNGPMATITSTDIICNGNCTGAASVGVISAGTPPYQVPVWVNVTPTVQANAIFSLCAGGYTAQLVDNNSCVTFTNVTISEPPPISILPNSNLPLCAGICNGTVVLNTSGGVAPYTYTWMPGASGGSVLTNACAGDYTVTVGYNSGSCTTQQIITIAPQSSISIAPPIIDPNRCFGDCAGGATVNVLSTPGGSATLSWNNGQFGPTANSLCNGIYSVNISDAQGCSNTFSVPITSPPQLTITPTITQPDCGLCNGSATVAGAGGSGTTYTFDWTNGSNSNTVSNLCAGLYQVLITDSANCKQTADLTINSSSGITRDTTTKTNESCFALCDGAATVTAIGGTSPISYKWLNTPVINLTNIATNLCSDLYYVLMTDARGCARTASVQIDPAVQLNVSAFVQPPTCSSSDGEINVFVNGGVAPYSYSWTPAAPNSGTISNLPAGSYTLTVTDNNGAGCSKTQVFVVSNVNGPKVFANQTNATCFGGCDGSVVLSSTAVPAATYTWSNGTNASSVTGLCDGIITVTASSGGCRTVSNFTITSKPKLFIDLNLQNVKCYGDCNGIVTVLPAGGTLPYAFNWTPPQIPVTNSMDSLCAGIYSVSIADANGCAGITSATVNQAPQIVITSTLQNSSCSSIADGSITVGITGGAPSFTYNWQGPGTFTSTQQNLVNVLAGTYSLSLVDSLNCAQDTAFSVIPTVTLIAQAGPDFSVCPGYSVTIDGSLSQGVASYVWLEIPQNNTLSTTSSLNIVEAIVTQTFALQVASVNNNCFDADTVEMFVFTKPNVDAGPSFTIPVYSSVTIGGNPTTDGLLTHTWSPSNYLDDPFAQNPVASNTTQVTYTVSIMYGNGCLESDTMVVYLYPEIKITNAFSPNADSKNDTWIIDYIDQFPENVVEIYNRWGELLFRSEGYKEPFDGTYHGSRLPVGTYYYVIQLNHPNYPKPYTGPLTIFR